MSYINQIRILEQKLQQLSNMPLTKDHTYKVLQIQQDIRKLKRLEWEENFERVNMEEDR